MSLLPSKPDISADGEPRVVGLDGEDAEAVLSALSSSTARRIVTELHEEPAPPSELADRVDSTIQNVQYHLSQLDDAGVVEVAGTAYSEKGREMDVYAPADEPLVIVAADEEETAGLRGVVSRLLGAVAVLLVGSAAVQQVIGDGLLPGPFAGTSGAGGGASGESDAAATTTPTPAPEPTAAEVATQTPAAVSAGGGDLVGTLPPGLLFFLGGLFGLILVTLVYAKTTV
ncbi:ArsR/SmtB family transcription factor [Halosegnis sp.]|uniref:ArsR/SmtB family transcription factor n=1 Tax=Halosegnis sp. TaxID=2864959 RepID=UPI0035D3F55A